MPRTTRASAPPTLPDLWLPQTLGTLGAVHRPGVTRTTPTSRCPRSPAATRLKPETSKQWQIGGVWSPISELQLRRRVFPHQAQQHHHARRRRRKWCRSIALGDPRTGTWLRCPRMNEIEQIKTFLYNTGSARSPAGISRLLAREVLVRQHQRELLRHVHGQVRPGEPGRHHCRTRSARSSTRRWQSGAGRQRRWRDPALQAHPDGDVEPGSVGRDGDAELVQRLPERQPRG